MSLVSRKRLRPSRQRTSLPMTAVESLEDRLMLSSTTIQPAEFASIDGTGNNLDNAEWGSTYEELLRLATVEYGDGLESPAGDERPSAREVSNTVAATEGSTPNDRYLTDILWVWGQFIDHDIDLTPNATDADGNPLESWSIEVPAGDPYFDPFGTGTATIDFSRSDYVDSGQGIRQQVNHISAFIDGSVVYGSDAERAAELRTFEGGQLKTSDGKLLPYNEAGLDNAGGPHDTLFLAGDVRANENVALSAMQTVWVREHNRIAIQLAAQEPEFTDQQLYQQARAVVTAELQAITYNEFLPALLGNGAIDVYQGYDPTVNPGVSNVFSTAAYRLGHSLLSPELLRLDDQGNVIAAGNLPLASAFFNPSELEEHGIDSLLRGATVNVAQELDNEIVDDVRNFLFGPPGAGGFDLAALNIQRGRDHGLADYNQARVDLGLDPVVSFSDITSDSELATRLEQVYGDVDNIDIWVGGLAEDHLPGSSVGELFSTVIIDQFERLRDGDRYWYQNVFNGPELAELEGTTLADVIERNTDIVDLQDHVFYSPSVMYVDLTATRSANVTVTVTEQNVEVVDGQTRRVIASQSLDELERVMLVGSDKVHERITLAITSAANLPGGLTIHAGADQGDTLVVHGTPDADTVLIRANQITVNGMVTEVAGIERLLVMTTLGDDQVDVADGVNETMQVVVADAERLTDGPHRHHFQKQAAHDHRNNDGGRHMQSGENHAPRSLAPNPRRLATTSPEATEETSDREQRRPRHSTPRQAEASALDQVFSSANLDAILF